MSNERSLHICNHIIKYVIPGFVTVNTLEHNRNCGKYKKQEKEKEKKKQQQ